LKERDHFEHVVVNGRIILKWILKGKCESVDCIYLAVDIDKWQYVVYCLLKHYIYSTQFVALEQPSPVAHTGIKGVEYLRCAASVDQPDCT
jgi:hypothetical protein